MELARKIGKGNLCLVQISRVFFLKTVIVHENPELYLKNPELYLKNPELYLETP